MEEVKSCPKNKCSSKVQIPEKKVRYSNEVFELCYFRPLGETQYLAMSVGSYRAFLMKLLKNVFKISWNKAESLSFNHILLDLQFSVVVCRSKTARSAFLSPKFYSAPYLGMTEWYLCSTQCAFNLLHPHSYKHVFCAFYLTLTGVSILPKALWLADWSTRGSNVQRSS